jgi:hypothetical protein
VIKLILVERRDSAVLGALFAACSLFSFQMPFDCINFSSKKGQRLLSGSILGFKAILFLPIKFGDFSAIRRVVVILVTIVTPHVGLLRILRRLDNTNGEVFLFFSTGSVAGLGRLVRLIFSKFSKRLKYETDSSQDISKMSILASTFA